MEQGKKGQIVKDILLTLVVLGILTAVAVVAPNAILALGLLVRKKKYTKRQITRALSHLKDKKILGIGNDGRGNTVIKLTDQGKAKIIRYKLEDMVLNKPKRWDQKWRIVIFDIPEKFRVNRNTLSQKLKALGFYQMQKSAWLWPYPVEDEVTFLKEVYEIRPFVSLVTADRIEGEWRYLKHFGLSKI
ncbi:MAG: hypothetical protein A3H72_00845 [Candidatus Doudnabacteria bacterium RIFCSPLOWO2_02_FULL_48_8]|uniref:Transcriptional repressor PaaX-like central Cas2-like domain-containing protein n=1 Tax=Candidatus Doudnabacteria bacterium RIFCSPHIGHO2_01_FULL_46_24 TaxID=1817825 RepID=A0A1F5NTN8_9BACT|nr:MAG: hypothetical protein A2720_03940 [Candidatus Doudnabacteria bacterium RIFCSPHIGHO2_01_FULL_46_24]OGE95239.1 MAG: hypothetical protein A3H72_00845 [Candidatus Doudnabacteria bacterium RIFCSPLOWO2_02_FULL_48_8]OGE95892.1 MAG: hypothetical protein A3E98_03950 [Candidatus Doudnabacteria bacterium RIFCSPHIGHO2_12_FULL_48_11]